MSGPIEEYVSRISLEVNGELNEDFTEFEEGEIEQAKQFRLMNRTGVTGVTPMIVSKVTYAIPKDHPEYDWSKLKDGTITVDYQNGTRKTFPHCYFLKRGATKHDGDKQSTCEIDIAHGEPIQK